MPIKHAALKQMRKDRKRSQRNSAIHAEVKTLTKRLLTLLDESKFDEASTLVQLVSKKYDHAASRNVIHRNTAARAKSRFMRQIHQRGTSPSKT